MKPFMWADSSDSTKHFVGGAQRLANHHLVSWSHCPSRHGRINMSTIVLVTAKKDEADLGEMGETGGDWDRVPIRFAAFGSTATAGSTMF